jgi:hypothetical protein
MEEDVASDQKCRKSDERREADDEEQTPQQAVFAGPLDLHFGGMGAVGQTCRPVERKAEIGARRLRAFP